MASDDFAKLRADIGKLVSISSFLSMSTDRQVTVIYVSDGATHPSMESVLFQITINVSEALNTY